MSKTGNQHVSRMEGPARRSGRQTEGDAVNELAAAYRSARGVPAARMASLRQVIRAHLDACGALVKGQPKPMRRKRVDEYLARLYVLRAESLPTGAWQLDVLKWLRTEANSEDYLGWV